MNFVDEFFVVGFDTIAENKRIAIPIHIKKEVCYLVYARVPYEEIRQKFGFKHLTNVSNIYKQKDKWIKEFDVNDSPLRKIKIYSH